MTRGLRFLRSHPLPVLLAVALVVRLVVAVQNPDTRLIFDPRDYARHAESIVAGDGFPPTVFGEPDSPNAIRAPAYPSLLAGVYAITGNSANAGKVVGALLGTVTVFLLYLVGHALWDRRVGLLAAGLAAVFPPLVMLNASLLSEVLFLPLVLALVLAVLAYRRSGGHLGWAAAIGALCGLAALTRAVGVVLLIPAVLATWHVRPRFGVRALVAPVLALGLAALTIAPWTIRNAAAFHQFVPLTTQAGFSLAGTYNDVARESSGYRTGLWRLPTSIPEFEPLFRRPGIDEAEIDRELGEQGREYLLDHPLYVAQVVGLNALRMFNLAGHREVTHISYDEMAVPVRARGLMTGSGHVLALLAALGVAGVALRRLPRPRAPVSVWLIPLLAFLSVIPTLGLPRYRVPLDLFLILFAALALAGVADAIRARRSAPLAAALGATAGGRRYGSIRR
jgi:hypothetical protein